jgi:hypothetical protein
LNDIRRWDKPGDGRERGPARIRTLSGGTQELIAAPDTSPRIGIEIWLPVKANWNIGARPISLVA